MLFPFSTSDAQIQNLSFKHLSIQEGLSSISATSIAQDSLGRIWIGTRDGLNVFDGNEIRHFRNIRNNPNSLLGTSVNQLLVHQNTLYTCTRMGLSVIDLTTECITQYPLHEIQSISTLDQKIVVGTSNGLFEFTPDKSNYFTKIDVFSKRVSINQIINPSDGELWIAGENGVFKSNNAPNKASLILNENATTIFIDTKNRTWIGTADNGVFLLDKHNKIQKHFTQNTVAYNLANNFVRTIAEDALGNIWIGTFRGLSIIQSQSLKTYNYTHEFQNPYSISHNSIYSILRDRQNNMWVTTYFGGVNYSNPSFDIFKTYKANPGSNKTPAYRIIGTMIEDDKSNLWIATEGGGLDYYNRNQGTFRHLNYKNNRRSFNNIKALHLANNNTLIIGTHLGGLYLLDTKTKKITELPYKGKIPNALPAQIVSSIIPYKTDYLLGTHSGIFKFNLEKQTFFPFLSGENQRYMQKRVITSLLEDHEGMVWIGTENSGLFCYHPQKDALKHYPFSLNAPKGISGNTISTLFEDSELRLWIGTLGSGLNLYNKKDDSFEAISSQNSRLLNNFIFGIKESKAGKLWILNSEGLSLYDVDKHSFQNFHSNNGFPLNVMNEGAICVTHDNELFVGGIDGLVSFKEKDLLKKNFDFELLFSKLSVNNATVTPNDETHILSKSIAYTKTISLKPHQNVFTLQFTESNYILNNNNLLQYTLEGFNSDWVDANQTHSATYTNLDPGTYTFKIRSIRQDNQECIKANAITIHIKPPIYRTWYAYVLYVMVILSLSVYIAKTYIRELRLKDKVKAEQNEKVQIKALNQSKLRFFTNISHEFRTPLTLITGTLETILEDSKTKPAIHNKLNTIHHSATRLNNLISELLDFRKLDQGYLQLKVSEYELNYVLEEIYPSFVEYANSRNISYTFSKPKGKCQVWFDKHQLEKVFYNLISNAFKIVDANQGKISITVLEKSSFVDVLITDNGPGMAQEEINKVFDRFYQIDQLKGKVSGKGSGLGLALSKGIIEAHKGNIFIESTEGVGSTFIVRLLKGKAQFNDAQIHKQKDEHQKHVPTTIASILKETKTEDVSSAEPHGLKLLIVEDNTEIRKMICDVFSDSYTIIEARDGAEGLDLAIKEQPDLIISDVMMPNLSGTEMCSTIKRNIQTCHIPVVLLTAKTAMEYKIEGLETGADEYITKPFNVKLLRARIKNILKNRAIIQEKFKANPTTEIKEIATNTRDLKMLSEAKSIIEMHLDDAEFDVNTFAKKMGLGRTRLYAKIKGLTGQTPNDFILSMRLKKAANMLINQPDLNVSEVAYAVGFSTPRYFSRCFKEHFGTSPSKYGENPSNA